MNSFKNFFLQAAFLLTLSVCLFISHMTQAAPWSSPQQISAENIYANHSQMAMDGLGNVVAAWIEQPSGEGPTTAAVASLPIGGTWSEITYFTPNTYTDATNISISINANGYAVVVWVDSSSETILSSTLQFGGSWSTPVIVFHDDNITLSSPSVIVDPSGNAVAIWEGYYSGHSQIQSSRLPYGGKWSSSMLVSPSDSNDYYLAQNSTGVLGVDNARNTIAVFFQDNSTNNNNQQVYIKSAILPFNASTAWLPVTDPNNNHEFSTSIVDSGPYVAVNRAGQAIMTWTFGGNVLFTANMAIDTETAWGPTTMHDSLTITSTPSIAINDAGFAILAWTSEDLGNLSTVIKASTSHFDGLWSEPTIISGPVTNNLINYFVQTTITEAGDAAAIWLNFSFFSSSLPETPAEIQVATLRFGNTLWSKASTVSSFYLTQLDQQQYYPSLQIFKTGYAVSVWDNEGMNVIDASTNRDIFAPQPPTQFLGSGKKNEFASSSFYYLNSSWTASSTQNVTKYRIYKAGVFVAEIPSTSLLIYQTKVPNKKSLSLFSITAIDSFGSESDPILINVISN